MKIKSARNDVNRALWQSDTCPASSVSTPQWRRCVHRLNANVRRTLFQPRKQRQQERLKG